ncbi:MAG TPA: succinylglutamate desuccinylase/aspartoacylase family protein [Candidatus Baltobacteraceae bacterium]|nr:succinylglutamate desuccinylase/aspartoacylase family protein [Candidatus Baltobacteraceae bacterium]
MTKQEATYQAIAARWKALRAAHDVRVREVACVGAARTLLCVEYGDQSLPAVHIAAGVHGDEPAGPHALLVLVESNGLDSRFSYRIWPCTNPSGYDARTRESIDGLDVNRTFGRGGSSPEARAIITANRDRKFELAIDLHEDDEASGFYCYEYGGAGIGRPLVERLASEGTPLDPREVLTPDPDAEAEKIGGRTLTQLLMRNAARLGLTLETPSAILPFAARVAIHVAAVKFALSQIAVK